MSLLIRRGRLVDTNGEIGEPVDLLIENGLVKMIAKNIDEPAETMIDAEGLVISAGLIDLHVHLRDPGQTHKEDVVSGLAAAAKGGFTGIACMPNTRPAVDSPELISYLKKREKEACGVHLYPIAAVTEGQRGEKVTDFPTLRAAGAAAFSDDGEPVKSAAVMRDALILARRCGVSVLSHCEDDSLVRGKAVNEGVISRKLGLEGRPAIAEDIMVMRDIMLSQNTGGPVHICHVSTRAAVEIIRCAKASGTLVTCETCPQYFTLTEEALLTQGTLAKVNPPLRTENDMEGILEGLMDGTIDVIATDHAPHSEEEKARGILSAPSGMVGLETVFAICLTELYHTGRMTMGDILRKLTVNPAAILRTNRGRVALGEPADLMLFDPDEEWTVKKDEFVSRGRNTPFEGRKLRGRVKYTLVDGKIVYSAEKGEK